MEGTFPNNPFPFISFNCSAIGLRGGVKHGIIFGSNAPEQESTSLCIIMAKVRRVDGD